MARQTESELYQNLVMTNFSFVERGEKHISEIYHRVSLRYSAFCDEEYPCHHRRTNTFEAEYKHTVRGALQRCKRISNLINKSER